MQKGLLAIALGLGGAITYMDTRPGWDDTGATAIAVFLSCGALGALGPKRPWMWALAVGLWIPLLGIVRNKNWGTLLALLIAFSGAYAGMAARKMFAQSKG